MSHPCINCVAITGSVPTRADNPADPITVSEQIESNQKAPEARAAICHAHVRNDDETPSSEPEKFARLKQGPEAFCQGVITQFSTGGRSAARAARGRILLVGPDMASLAVGSNNFPARVYENPPDLIDWLAAEMVRHDVRPEIEAFDLSHIVQAARMHADGRFPHRPYVQFVLGVKNAMPADGYVFKVYVRRVHRLFGTDAPWCAAGIRASQIDLNTWSIVAGGHARTGLEDNVRLDRSLRAPPNAALVRRTVEICEKHDRPVASSAQARHILGLRPVPPAIH